MKARRPGHDPRYLVVAGSSSSRRGRGHVVGAFDEEEEARAAFVGLRLRATDVDDWGHLAAVQGPAEVRLLCWFGDGRRAELPNPSGSRFGLFRGRGRRRGGGRDA